MAVDPISLEVFKNMFISVSEEMGVALQRTSYSPNIKERKDFSCAIFEPQGQMVAQAAHQPVHLGAMPASVQAALDTFPGALKPGDMVQNLSTEQRYILAQRFGRQAWIGVRTTSISDPDQWRRVTEDEKETA